MSVNQRPKSARQTLCLMKTRVAGVPGDGDLLIIYQVCIINIQCISKGPDN